jgi:hypothetical protein
MKERDREVQRGARESPTTVSESEKRLTEEYRLEYENESEKSVNEI